MSAELWLDTEAEKTLDLGVDAFTLYRVFADLDHVVQAQSAGTRSGPAAYPQLFGVIEASELQDDVDPAWLRQVRRQAGRFLRQYRPRLSEEAVTVLEALSGREGSL